ncbi:MAG: hypothetical protein sL5_02370 [Candidatus Mesenet longicola]|uniref:Uncharacterized protein n=1 Tax=Candidatus Mesenet longicola TaxID=1892558 RepID=A0A8J3HNQ7_9RICK|nr:MAG: hypothetical protein sGL2_02650 [Candidatus Mesenet longicola]GHM59244.1 MAG: hypothetical protein sL5_02370 [Candidatus Mesenet longicola]
MRGEELKKYLREGGYKYLDAGHSKKGLGQYLSRHYTEYQNNGSNQGQQQVPSGNNSQNQQQTSGNTSQATPNASTQPIIIEHKSRFDFWDIMLLSCLWGRGGNTTIINNYAPGTNRGSNGSDNSVLGPCIAAFCLIFATVASYFLLSYAAYKIKNAKLENNKHSIPAAIGLGVFSFSVSATLILLLTGMIVPNLERAMGISSGAFTGFQVITGLNAVIFGLGAVLFFYLAIDKASKKALVDREVNLIINCGRCSPNHGTSGGQYRGQQFPQNEQYQMRPDQHFTPTQPNQQYPSAPPQPPSYEESMYNDQFYTQSGASGYNHEYQFQQYPQSYLNNPGSAQYSDKSPLL